MTDELTIKKIEDSIEEEHARLRHLKRTQSINKLINAVAKLSSDTSPDLDTVKLVQKQCYEFIAQHRALIKTHRFLTDKQLNARLKRNGRNGQ